MIGLPNPYVLAAGGIGVLMVGASLYIQSTLIHKYHVLYDNDEKTIVIKDQQIRNMTTAQNNQTGKSEQNVIKVIQGPREVQSIIREIQAAPAKPCTAPIYPDEVNNAF